MLFPVILFLSISQMRILPKATHIREQGFEFKPKNGFRPRLGFLILHQARTSLGNEK